MNPNRLALILGSVLVVTVANLAGTAYTLREVKEAGKATPPPSVVVALPTIEPSSTPVSSSSPKAKAASSAAIER